MASIKHNAQKIIQQIENTAKKYASFNNKIQLIAVSKTKPISDIEQAIDAGLRHFGENYVQEAIEKIQHFQSHDTGLAWHLIGPIQSNKTRLIAENFDWVHCVDRSKIAQRLNEQRPNQLAPLQVLIQINTSFELSKSGMNINNKKLIIALANEIEQLPQLRLRGLMCIPAPCEKYADQLAAFAPLRALFDDLRSHYSNFDTLSMGMSDDMQAAIASGSTMVRIGSAIFGERKKSHG